MWEVVGVSAPEERVYEALIRSGPTAVSDLGKRAALGRIGVDVVEMLEVGRIFEISES